MYDPTILESEVDDTTNSDLWGFDWTGIVLSSIEVIVVVGGLGADLRQRP
jgi:hypothetical protein